MNRKAVGNYIENYNFPYCDDVTKYEKVAKIGHGTFGVVYRGKNKSNPKEIVAMKKILMENETQGFPITALRELKILKALKHTNVVRLIEICKTKATAQNRYLSSFYFIFEFCDHDLSGLLANKNVKFTLGEIKKVIQQLLNGLYFIHVNKILHRDMKPSNILITKTGVLKIADFGLARPYSEMVKNVPNRYTNRVVTIWYRPPELLLGERNYGPAIDIWGAGCIMAEMWTRTPILQGSSEQSQLTKISRLCGSITPDVWPGVRRLDFFNKMELIKGERRIVRDQLRPCVKVHYAIDLIDKMLILDPAKRINADSALNHDFFWTNPMPSDLSNMLSQHKQSMFQYTATSRSVTQRQRPSTSSDQSSSTSESEYKDRIY